MRRYHYGRSKKNMSSEANDNRIRAQTDDRCPYLDDHNNICGVVAKHKCRFCVRHHKQLQVWWETYKNLEKLFDSIWLPRDRLDLQKLNSKIQVGCDAVFGRTEVTRRFYYDDAEGPGHVQPCDHDNKRHSEYNHDDKRAQYSGCDQCWRHIQYVKHTDWIQQLQVKVDSLQHILDNAMSRYNTSPYQAAAIQTRLLRTNSYVVSTSPPYGYTSGSRSKLQRVRLVPRFYITQQPGYVLTWQVL
ncbi:hypothetical protein BKA56DRAFT_597240 [Ilyonectria sp. MPI-CAGE-AT-0026]|nr:hypothetical protein BKA56DRAFT_597240 [Ilyonectria sp. MPI-CAGE-AT-0026]